MVKTFGMMAQVWLFLNVRTGNSWRLWGKHRCWYLHFTLLEKMI